MSRSPTTRNIKQDRAVKTRREILDRAITLFARRGILATTMAELARAIRMTPGALYWHFATKEDLVLAAIEELHVRFVASFQPVLSQAVSAKWSAHQQLTTFVEHTGRFLMEHREHGIFFGMVGAESAENSPDIAQALRESLDVYVQAVVTIIRYGQTKTKEFRADVDAITLANAIIFANIGLVVQHNLFRERLSYEPMVRTLSTMVLDGVRRR